jgi:hypothetical protein
MGDTVIFILCQLLGLILLTGAGGLLWVWLR